MSFKNVVLFGAGGTTIGHHILQALVVDGDFDVTAIIRESSKTTFPATVNVIRIANRFAHSELVKALRGQDVVVSATGLSGHESQFKLIEAAIEAGVQRFIPSEWGMDNGDLKNQELCPIFKLKGQMSEYLGMRENDSFTWIAVATGIWLDWSVLCC